ncbi:MAG: peptidoglycan-binding protein [Egibacteraceae bacterium]
MTFLIRHGDASPAVEDVQRRLAAVDDPTLRIDGVFGDATREAVQRFQRHRGLAADGVVGTETWRILVEAGYTLGDRLLWRTRIMMRGDDVRDLQHRLNQLGFDAGSEDGIFGPLAHAAVEDFQRNVGLEVDGVAGPATIDLLRRMRRDHQTSGAGIRAREREALRRLSGRGLVGARILVDPSHGPGDPGHVGPSGVTEADVSWQIASRLAARLGARGAQVTLARGPGNNPSQSARARLGNDQGAEVVLSIGVGAVGTPAAAGSAAYYFGAPHFVSEAGQRLAELASDHMVAAGWVPDCRVHPMTWALLRETRMTAIVVEPGFITNPVDEARLADPAAQERLAAALTESVAAYYTVDEAAAV